jgi:hypothetical protein
VELAHVRTARTLLQDSGVQEGTCTGGQQGPGYVLLSTGLALGQGYMHSSNASNSGCALSLSLGAGALAPLTMPLGNATVAVADMSTFN